MTAGINDKFKNTSTGTRPVSTTVSTLRIAGSTSLICSDLTGWATDTAVDFITYKIDGQSKLVTGSQRDWKGIVSASTINSLTQTDGGTDLGNAVGDIVVILPTARWGKDLTDGIRVQHNQDGTHAAITAPSIVVAGNTTIGGTLGVTGAVSATSIAMSGSLTGTGLASQVQTQTNAGTAGGTIYYINLGGIKMAWGNTGTLSLSATAAAAYTVIFPTSFFTTVQSFTATVGGGTATSTPNTGIGAANAVTSTQTNFYFISTSGAAITASISRADWFAIGT